jgi:hypothetical protein
MLCKFCHREFEDGLSECPYCHYVVDVEAQTLTKDERDTFSGVTIEQDGTVVKLPDRRKPIRTMLKIMRIMNKKRLILRVYMFFTWEVAFCG